MIKLFQIKPITIIIAMPLALLSSNAIFSRFIQDNLPFLSRRNLALAAVVFVILFVAITIIWNQFTNRAGWYCKIERSRKWRVLAAAALLSIYLVGLANTNKTSNLYKNPLLYPIQTISIEALGEKNPVSTGYSVEMIQFDNQFGHTSYMQFETSGQWIRSASNTLILDSHDNSGSIRWQGRTGEYALIGFAQGPDRGKILVTVNNAQTKTIDLYAAKPKERILRYSFPPSVIDRIATVLLEFNLVIIAVYLLLLYSGTLRWVVAPIQARRGHWLLYMLPMIAGWGLCLLALWPGIMGSDSLVHFRQAWFGGLNDWHAVLYTLLIGALTQINTSPAVTATFQILCLALTVAWGLRFYDQTAAPRWLPWAISGWMALSMPIAFNVITLWKDIPYSTAVLAITLMVLFTVNSEGKWLDRKMNIAALGLVSALIILLRQNGLLVPLAVFAVLVLLDRARWKAVLASLCLVVGIYLLFTGPVYRLLKVNTETYKINAIIIHHLGAHINAGTPLQPDEEEFLYHVMPAGHWARYDCTLHNILWYKTEIIDREFYNRNSAFGMRTLLRLFLANPMVDVDHILCASSMVWSPAPKAYFMESAVLLPSGKWVVNNELGIKENSLLPGVAAWLYRWYVNIDQGSLFVYILVWRPAVPLFATLAFGMALALKSRKWQYLAILVPLVVHSLTLIMVNVAQDLRYMFPAYLIAPIFFGFLFIPKVKVPEE